MTFSTFTNYKRTTDDRGQSVPCRSLQSIQRQASRDRALAATADRIVAEARTHFTMWHGAALGVSFPLFIFVSKILLPSDPFWLHLVPPVIALPILGIMVSRYHWRKVMPGLTRILIEEGICASCMYPLEGLADDADGMLVCPECSASWQRSRILRFVPIARSSTALTSRSTLTFFLSNMRSGLDRRGIRDDRDSPRAVIAMRSVGKTQLGTTSHHQKRLDAAVQVLKPKGRTKRFMLASMFVLIVASMTFPLVIISRIGSGLPLIIFLPLGLIGMMQFVMAILVLLSDHGRPSKLVRSEFLNRHMCPCCAADLIDQQPESDNQTVCPACGAAWAFSRGVSE